MSTKRFGWLLSGAVWVAIGVLTLTPSGGPDVPLEFWCVACGSAGGIDVVANIIMFAPLGFGLALATGRRVRPLLFCVATTMFIEAMQVRIVSGRDASLSDLLANSLGAWIGIELALRRRVLLTPGATAGRLALGWLVACTAALWATSWGMTPSHIPEQLWIQWLPPRPSFEPFTGTLLWFDIDSIPLPLGYPSPSLGLSQRLRSERWRATATVSTRGMVSRRSVIVRVAEEYGAIQSLEQSGVNLTCWQKTRADDFRFRGPRASLRNGFIDPAVSLGDTAVLHCERRDGRLIAALSRGDAVRSYSLRLSPSLGWVLLSPFAVEIDDRYRVIGAVWLALLFLPAGFWTRRARARVSVGVGDSTRRSRTLWYGPICWGAIASALVIGLWWAPTFWHVSPAALWEWLSALGGVVAGVLLASVRLFEPRVQRSDPEAGSSGSQRGRRLSAVEPTADADAGWVARRR